MIKKYLYTKFPKFYGQFIYSKNKYLLFLKIIKLKLGLEVYFGGKAKMLQRTNLKLTFEIFPGRTKLIK